MVIRIYAVLIVHSRRLAVVCVFRSNFRLLHAPLSQRATLLPIFSRRWGLPYVYTHADSVFIIYSVRISFLQENSPLCWRTGKEGSRRRPRERQGMEDEETA